MSRRNHSPGRSRDVRRGQHKASIPWGMPKHRRVALRPSRREQLPIQDAADVEDWKDYDTLRNIYQQPDEATQRRVLRGSLRIQQAHVAEGPKPLSSGPSVLPF